MDITQKLEELFGIAQSVKGGSMDFSAFQLHYHISDYSVFLNMCLEPLECEKGKKRINICNNRKSIK